jgi:hypothetical protein
MGIRQWFLGLLSRGEAPAPDPSAMVELEVARLVDAPMIVAALRREGIDAASIEAFDPVTAVTRARVMVRRSDVPAALEAMERLR